MQIVECYEALASRLDDPEDSNRILALHSFSLIMRPDYSLPLPNEKFNSFLRACLLPLDDSNVDVQVNNSSPFTYREGGGKRFAG